MVNNKWSKAPQKQWWQALAAAGASILGNMMSNDQSEKNVETSIEGQRYLRQNAYQDTVADLRAAGLNPMLAYSNGANATAAVPVAQNRPVTDGAMTSAMNALQMQNAEAQNELIRAQAAKTLAETEAIPTSTANLAAQTRQIEHNLPKIEQEIKNLKTQNLTEQERVALTRSQNRLTQIQEDLAKGQISNTEALTETQKVLTQLRRLEIPGAKNIADWESRIGEVGAAGGTLGTGAKVLEGLTNSARKVFGK